MHRRAHRRVLAAAIALASGCAAAGPGELVGRDVVLPRRGGEAAFALELNLSKRHVYAPVSFAPDIYLAATGNLTIGVIHSARATGVIDAGGGLCVRDSLHGCPRAYDNAGIDVRYRARRGYLAIAWRARVVASTFDPWKPSIRPGALLRLHLGRYGVIADPHVEIGLANRDRGNRDWLRLPLWLAYQPARGVAIALRTGLDGEFATFTDTVAIPIGLDVTARVAAGVEVSAFVAFPTLLGPQNQFNPRVAAVTVSWRWR